LEARIRTPRELKTIDAERERSRTRQRHRRRRHCRKGQRSRSRSTHQPGGSVCHFISLV